MIRTHILLVGSYVLSRFASASAHGRSFKWLLVGFRITKDKRRSRDAIRSLLDLMSENRSMQSVYTMDASHGSNGYSHNGVGAPNNNIVR